MLGNDFTQGQKNEFNLPDLGFGGPQFPQSNFGFDNNSWNFSARMDMGGPMNSAVNTNFGYSASNLNATGAVAGPLASSIPQASASSVPAVTFPSASGTVSPPPIQSATSAGAGAGGGMHGSAGAMGGGMGMGMGMGMGGMSGMTGMGGMGGGGDWGSMGNMNTMGSMGNMGSMGSMGSINAPQASATSAASWDGSSLENEPPLLEELGIDFKEIIAKTKAVVFPVLSSGGLKPKGPQVRGLCVNMVDCMSCCALLACVCIVLHLLSSPLSSHPILPLPFPPQSSEADGADADLAGPLVFGLLLGVVLLFTGKGKLFS